MKIKRLFTLLIAAALTASLASCGQTGGEDSKSYRIGICNYVDDASLNQIADNIRARLDERGQELGVGEILLNSMDADGTKAGFDLAMLRAVREAVSIPVIASGGAGAVEHFAPAVHAGADAVLAASVFHFGDMTVGDVKKAMAAEGITVR